MRNSLNSQFKIWRTDCLQLYPKSADWWYKMSHDPQTQLWKYYDVQDCKVYSARHCNYHRGLVGQPRLENQSIQTLQSIQIGDVTSTKENSTSEQLQLSRNTQQTTAPASSGQPSEPLASAK
eukprot:Lankesteria_metandrocarpae@DN5580_c0_g1_i1.p1